MPPTPPQTPKPRGLLKPETYAKINAHLDKKWPHPRVCPVCSTKDWHIQSGAVAQLVEEMPETGYLEPSDRLIPTFMTICLNCYFFRSFLMVPVVEVAEDANAKR
jgi:hypothetical protein